VGAKRNKYWEPSVRPATAITLPERNPDSLLTSTSAHVEPGIFDPRSWGPKLVDWAFPYPSLDDVAQTQIGASTPEEHRIAESTQRAWESGVERDVVEVAGLLVGPALKRAQEIASYKQKMSDYFKRIDEFYKANPTLRENIDGLYDVEGKEVPWRVRSEWYRLVNRDPKSHEIQDWWDNYFETADELKKSLEDPLGTLIDESKIALEEGRLKMEYLARLRGEAYGGEEYYEDWMPEGFELEDPVPEEYYDEFVELLKRYLEANLGEDYLSPAGPEEQGGVLVGSKEPPEDLPPELYEDWAALVQALADTIAQLGADYGHRPGWGLDDLLGLPPSEPPMLPPWESPN